MMMMMVMMIMMVVVMMMMVVVMKKQQNLVWQGPKNADDGEELKNIGVLHVRRHVGEHLKMFSLSQHHDYEVLCAHQ